jgi:hypothetical protein
MRMSRINIFLSAAFLSSLQNLAIRDPRSVSVRCPVGLEPTPWRESPDQSECNLKLKGQAPNNRLCTSLVTYTYRYAVIPGTLYQEHTVHALSTPSRRLVCVDKKLISPATGS